MHLLNAGVAVATAVVGTFGATVAYGSLNTPPVGHSEPILEPVRLTHYLPCDPPATLSDGVCVTTKLRVVVKTPEPIVITVDKRTPSKGSSSKHHKASAKHDDHGDHDGDDDDHGDDDGGGDDHDDD